MLPVPSAVMFPAGLQSQHLPEAAVERPPPGVQRVPRRLAGPGPVHVGLHLETRLVLRQREGGQLPRGHHRQQATAHFQKRQRALQHTVSRSGLMFHLLFRLFGAGLFSSQYSFFFFCYIRLAPN